MLWIRKPLAMVFWLGMMLVAGVSMTLASQGALASSEGFHVTDMTGREVTFDAPARRVIAIGPGALRLCAYFQDVDMIVGIEQMDRGSAMGKPYVIANPAYADLPVIGAGGPNNAPDPEKILAVRPEVIFSTYGADRSVADNLQNKTGIPVVAISYGKTAVFDPELYDSIGLIGKVTGYEEKAKLIVDYMESCRRDLDQRTKDIADSEKPTVYMGAINMKGSLGIESTQGNYALFNAVHAKNVVDELGKTGSLMIDKEQLIRWNPDIIFLDQGGLEPVRQDYQKNSRFYNILSAVRNGKLYAQLPYNYYSTNIDTAMANAYYIGKVLYPKQFEDIDPIAKADEIYTSLLGKALYDEMAKDFGGFMEVRLD
ncbi:MAG: iron ABC transporter substrate-binding protein [Firmicutes bacterium]|nr:iron ABC transporter substrate-binding protein [Bacillota bacterium]